MTEKYHVDATVRQVMGVMDGPHGTEAVQVDAAVSASAYGLPLRQVVGRPLGDGTRVRVTVEILDERPLHTNALLSESERRSPAEVGNAALLRPRCP